MEPKKNEKYDLERKNPLFFSIGLVVALLIVILAFEWRGEFEGMEIRPSEDIFEEAYIVPNTVIPAPKPPEPVKIERPKMNLQPPVFVQKELPEVVKPAETIEEIPFEKMGVAEPTIETAPEVFEGVVETMPEYPGGISAFYAYVSRNIEYPKAAKNRQLTGRVYVQFVIDTDGRLTEVKALKGIGLGCDEEAVRVIENSPAWSPGKQRGRAVKFRMVLPIHFSLAQ